MSFKLPDLPYPFDALEPVIDSQTMEIHYTKHHQAYITNLNNALEQAPEFKDKTILEVITNIDKMPEQIRTTVKNNAGGHYNHTLFWEIMMPALGSQPSPELTGAIKKAFGDLDTLKEQFLTAAKTRFGSGWAWLSVTSEGNLEVSSTPNQDNPIMEGKTPILGLDVWEHAYYLRYQNRRPEYVDNWWNIINWEIVSDKFSAL